MNYLILKYHVKNEHVKLMDRVLKDDGFSHKKNHGNETIYSNVIQKFPKIYGTEFDDIFMKEATRIIHSALGDRDLINTTLIEVNDIITDVQLGVNYFDGSYANGKTSGCGIVCMDVDPNGTYESFTNKKYKIKHKAKLVHDQGTNNIGELHGLLFALEELTEKPYQLIVGDSEYVIKSFREWIFNWEKRNWKSSTGKTILNLGLIKEIYEKINNLNHTLIFKWTKGHNDDSMNEMCDYFCGELTQGLSATGVIG